jgi:ribosomal protein S18 acetylase RimI-like enzyme
MEEAGLYLVDPKELEKLADIAMDAYKDYPLHNWFSDGKYDEKASKLIMLISLKTMTKDAVIYADSKEMNGFAIWLPFGFEGSKTIPFLMNGALKLIAHSGFKILGRMITYENFAMNLKKKYTEHVDWYLYNLLIKKSAQGKGIASKLMKPMLEFCDQEAMQCYLETNKEVNVSLYEHYGFELKETAIVPKSDVIHYSMVRMPKSLNKKEEEKKNV